MNENNTGLFYPSFEVERKTKAFNKYIIFFISAISIFTVPVVIGCCFYAFMADLLNLVVDNLSFHLSLYVLIPVIIFIIFSYQLFQFINALLHSYKFNDNQIIKGRIIDNNKVNELDLVVNSAVLLGEMNSIGKTNSNHIKFATFDRSYNIIRLIGLNTNKDFVNTYFDTNLYKKNIYNNPRLIKMTKYSLIYACDNDKKLVIPKIYKGMFSVDNSNSSSFISRILKRSMHVFIIALIIAIVDLSTSYIKNNTYVNNISISRASIEQNLYSYNYVMNKINESVYSFTRFTENNQSQSKIIYTFDKKGNIKNVSVQLYYNTNSSNIENELKYIISTINTEFNNSDISNFINLVKENINGNYKYGKLVSENYSLIISKSNGYVDIHNY